jgi:hypothetical protein
LGTKDKEKEETEKKEKEEDILSCYSVNVNLNSLLKKVMVSFCASDVICLLGLPLGRPLMNDFSN